MARERSLASEFPGLAKDWHPELNGDLRPEDVAPYSNKKAWWLGCPKGHPPYDIIVSNRSQHGQGCPYCSGRRVAPGGSLADLHPDLMKEWAPANTVSPYKIPPGHHKYVKWKCPGADDHEWEAAPKSRTRLGYGCPCCEGLKIVKSNCLATLRPDLLAEYHPNNTVSPYEIGPGHTKKVWWKCPVADDHEWEGTPENRKAGKGCPCCAGQKVVKSNCLRTTHPHLAAELHPTLNGPVTADNVIAGTGKRLTWQCSKDPSHVWAAPGSRRAASGAGCPLCSESHGEAAVAAVLKKLKIPHRREWRFDKFPEVRRLFFDFVMYHNKKIAVIEYQGEQHYHPVTFGSLEPEAATRNFEGCKRRDQRKRDWCKSRDIPLLEIPYTEPLNNVTKVVQDWLLFHFEGSPAKGR